MAEIRNPNLFHSDRHRPFGVRRPRRDRGPRPNRNPRFVPEMLEGRLALSNLASVPVEVASDDLPKPPKPLPEPTLPFDPPVPKPPSGPAIPF